jgi:hypothetical protein
MRGHDFGCGILSFALSYDSNRDLPRFLGFFGFRTSVVSSRFIIMRFSSSGADPAVQCAHIPTEQQTAAMRTCARACFCQRACVRALPELTS